MQEFIRRFKNNTNKNPDAIAIETSNNTLSYKQLDLAANNLAAYLKTKFSLLPNDRIAVCLPRSIDLIISIIACEKLGVSFKLVDSSEIPTTIKKSDAYFYSRLLEPGFKTIISTDAMLKKLHTSVAQFNTKEPPFDVAAVNDLLAQAHHISTELPEVKEFEEFSGVHEAYIAQTSGTTAQPKQVVVSSQSQDGFYYDLGVKTLKLDGTCKVLLDIPPRFDAIIGVIYFTLISGSTLFLPTEDEILDLERLFILCRDRNVNVMIRVPSLAREQLDFMAPLADINNLILMFTGEKLTQDVVEEFFKFRARIINAYGPTEGPMGLLAHEVLPDSNNTYLLPNDLSGRETAILTENHERARVGEEGTICYRTKENGFYYLNNPGKTHEKQTYLQGDSDIWWQTGDRARLVLDPNTGQLGYEILGRTDNLEKINGEWVDPVAVSKLLEKLDDIQDVRVESFKEKGSVYQCLVVAIILKPEATTNIKAIRSYIEESYRYIIGLRIIKVDNFPTTTEVGKLDIKQLLNYGDQEKSPEDRIKQVWNEILNIEPEDSHHYFHELGGKSFNYKNLKSVLNKEGLIDLYIFGKQIDELAMREELSLEGLIDIYRSQKNYRENLSIINQDTFNPIISLGDRNIEEADFCLRIDEHWIDHLQYFIKQYVIKNNLNNITIIAGEHTEAGLVLDLLSRLELDLHIVVSKKDLYINGEHSNNNFYLKSGVDSINDVILEHKLQQFKCNQVNQHQVEEKFLLSYLYGPDQFMKQGIASYLAYGWGLPIYEFKCPLTSENALQDHLLKLGFNHAEIEKIKSRPLVFILSSVDSDSFFTRVEEHMLSHFEDWQNTKFIFLGRRPVKIKDFPQFYIKQGKPQQALKPLDMKYASYLQQLKSILPYKITSIDNIGTLREIPAVLNFSRPEVREFFDNAPVAMTAEGEILWAGEEHIQFLDHMPKPEHKSNTFNSLISRTTKFFNKHYDAMPLIVIPPLTGEHAFEDVWESLQLPVISLSHPSLIDEQVKFNSLIELCEYFSSVIQTLVPNGEINLLGWSYGGICVNEIAALLNSAGRKVKNIVVVDSPNPEYYKRLSNTQYHGYINGLLNWLQDTYKLKDYIKLLKLDVTLEQADYVASLNDILIQLQKNKRKIIQQHSLMHFEELYAKVSLVYQHQQHLLNYTPNAERYLAFNLIKADSSNKYYPLIPAENLAWPDERITSTAVINSSDHFSIVSSPEFLKLLKKMLRTETLVSVKQHIANLIHKQIDGDISYYSLSGNSNQARNATSSGLTELCIDFMANPALKYGVLVAPPGGGKSITLNRVFDVILSQYEDLEQLGYYPIKIRLQAGDSDVFTNFFTAQGFSKYAITEHLTKLPLVFFIDDYEQSQIPEIIAAFKHWPLARYFMPVRNEILEASPNFMEKLSSNNLHLTHVINICPLTKADQFEYLQTRFPEVSHLTIEKLLTELNHDNRFKDILENPLQLYMLAELMIANKLDQSQDNRLDLPVTQLSLYWLYSHYEQYLLENIQLKHAYTQSIVTPHMWPFIVKTFACGLAMDNEPEELTGFYDDLLLDTLPVVIKHGRIEFSHTSHREYHIANRLFHELMGLCSPTAMTHVQLDDYPFVLSLLSEGLIEFNAEVLGKMKAQLYEILRSDDDEHDLARANALTIINKFNDKRIPFPLGIKVNTASRCDLVDANLTGMSLVGINTDYSTARVGIYELDCEFVKILDKNYILINDQDKGLCLFNFAMRTKKSLSIFFENKELDHRNVCDLQSGNLVYAEDYLYCYDLETRKLINKYNLVSKKCHGLSLDQKLSIAIVLIENNGYIDVAIWDYRSNQLIVFANINLEPVLSIKSNSGVLFIETEERQYNFTYNAFSLGHKRVLSKDVNYNSQRNQYVTKSTNAYAINIFDLESNKLIDTITTNIANISLLKFSYDGNYLAVGYSSGYVLIYNYQTRNKVYQYMTMAGVSELDFEQDSNYLVVIDENNLYHYIDFKKHLNTIAYDKRPAYAMELFAHHPDSKYIITSDGLNHLHKWSAVTGKCLGTHNYPMQFQALGLSDQGRYTIAISDQINIWDSQDGSFRQLPLIANDQIAKQVLFVEPEHIYIRTQDQIQLYNFNTYSKSINLSSENIIKFNNALLTTSDKTIYLFDTNLNLISKFEAKVKINKIVTISRNHFVYSSDDTNSLYVIEYKNGEFKQTQTIELQDHTPITAMTFNKFFGRAFCLVLATRAGRVSLWLWKDKLSRFAKQLCERKVHRGAVNYISADAKTLITIGADMTINYWQPYKTKSANYDLHLCYSSNPTSQFLPAQRHLISTEEIVSTVPENIRSFLISPGETLSDYGLTENEYKIFSVNDVNEILGLNHSFAISGYFSSEMVSFEIGAKINFADGRQLYDFLRVNKQEAISKILSSLEHEEYRNILSWELKELILNKHEYVRDFAEIYNELKSEYTNSTILACKNILEQYVIEVIDEKDYLGPCASMLIAKLGLVNLAIWDDIKLQEREITHPKYQYIDNPLGHVFHLYLSSDRIGFNILNKVSPDCIQNNDLRIVLSSEDLQANLTDLNSNGVKLYKSREYQNAAISFRKALAIGKLVYALNSTQYMSLLKNYAYTNFNIIKSLMTGEGYTQDEASNSNDYNSYFIAMKSLQELLTIYTEVFGRQSKQVSMIEKKLFELKSYCPVTGTQSFIEEIIQDKIKDLPLYITEYQPDFFKTKLGEIKEINIKVNDLLKDPSPSNLAEVGYLLCLQEKFAQAFKFLKTAALSKNCYAMYNLSYLYLHGLGVEKSVNAAIKLNSCIEDYLESDQALNQAEKKLLDNDASDFRINAMNYSVGMQSTNGLPIQDIEEPIDFAEQYKSIIRQVPLEQQIKNVDSFRSRMYSGINNVFAEAGIDSALDAYNMKL